MEFKKDQLRLAQMRYYSVSHHGVEKSKHEVYAILLESEDHSFCNVLNPGMEFPVYKRIPFPNYTLDKETFGTKIALASGEEKDGLCYVLESDSLNKFFRGDTVSMDTLLEKYVIPSRRFFYDRLEYMEERKEGYDYPLEDKILNDTIQREEFDQYIAQCEEETRKEKEYYY